MNFLDFMMDLLEIFFGNIIIYRFTRFFSFILFLKNVLSLKNKLVHLQFILITLLSLIGFGDLTSPGYGL